MFKKFITSCPISEVHNLLFLESESKFNVDHRNHNVRRYEEMGIVSSNFKYIFFCEYSLTPHHITIPPNLDKIAIFSVILFIYFPLEIYNSIEVVEIQIHPASSWNLNVYLLNCQHYQHWNASDCFMTYKKNVQCPYNPMSTRFV